MVGACCDAPVAVNLEIREFIFGEADNRVADAQPPEIVLARSQGVSI